MINKTNYYDDRPQNTKDDFRDQTTIDIQPPVKFDFKPYNQQILAKYT